MIEHLNVSLMKFQDKTVDKVHVPASAQKTVEQGDFWGLPVYIKVGAIQYKIGTIQKARKGREEVFGDIVLEVTGDLVFKPVFNEDKEVSGITPVKFVYVKE